MYLRQCPFCGSKGSDISIFTEERTDRPQCKFTSRVLCLNCFAEVRTHGFHWTYQEAQDAAIKAWNRRVNHETI